MRYVQVETQGESKTAVINCDRVTYLAESIYGTSIHFDSGEYLVCVGELRDIAAKISSSSGAELLLLQPKTEVQPALRLG